MVRRGSGLRVAIKIVKAVDRAQKQSARQADRDRRVREREAVAREKYQEQQRRAEQRAAEAREKALIVAEREREKRSYESRVKARAALRAEFIRKGIGR